MIFILLIIGTMLIGDILFWRWGNALVRKWKFARLALGIFTALMLAHLAFMLIAPRESRRPQPWLPAPFAATSYIWHLVVLPVWLITTGVSKLPRLLVNRVATQSDQPSRREMLGAALTAVPPLVAFTGAIRAIPQLKELRVRRIDVPLATLPAALDGMTIAHVTDTHIGRFTRDGMLEHLADLTNNLHTDLILFTGDLIDIAIEDLPRGLAFLDRLDPRAGLFICEGNHDLISDRDQFRRTMKSSKHHLLLDESRTVHFRGESIQVIGSRWNRGAEAMSSATRNLDDLLDPNAFSILLAHHPHAWEHTRAALTLSGHTHGGQFSLNERLGVGAIMYRYWSGLYQRKDQSLVVSNGAGNWFPLRINTPAEVIHLTLRRA